MQLKPALTAAIQRLEAACIGSPRLNAETLMMFVLGVNRSYLYGHPELELNPEEQARYDEVVALRATGMPAQYITGHQEFWGLDLLVTPAVLIPRPETEHLVETVMELLREHSDLMSSELKIVDVGAGSGAIALALANELPFAKVYATEISPDALEVAQANAARLQLQRIRFVHSNVLEGLGNIHGFDFVVSNPPYVADSEADKVQQSVKDFEPRMSVFAGEDGLNVIRRLVQQASAALKPGGWLAVEIGYSMRDAVLALLCPTLWGHIRVVPDLQGIPRVVAAQKHPNSGSA